MKLKFENRAPWLIAAGVIGLVCGVRALRLDYFERLESMTYDMRVIRALEHPAKVSTNLGFVFLDESTVAYLKTNRTFFPPGFGLPWPRQVYGRLVSELHEQGARAIAFDILFSDLRPDHPMVQMGNGRFVESDEFFALQIGRAGNVILATEENALLPAWFRTNAHAQADIFSQTDSDGILRRVRAFRMFPHWHRAFLQLEADPEYGVDLSKARIESRQVVLPRADGKDIKIPLDADGNFDLTDFSALPPGTPSKAKPLEAERVWHLGVVLAAETLGLDLENAEVDLKHGQIRLFGPDGIERILPVDSEGYFLINWTMPVNHSQLLRAPMQKLLADSTERLEGRGDDITSRWHDKIVIVGSAALIGNNLTDFGTTPLGQRTPLVSKHWNVANSIIQNRFVRRTSFLTDLGIIAVLAALSALLARNLRISIGLPAVALLAVVYVVAGSVIYVRDLVWVPLVLPVLGIGAMTLGIVAWRVVFEQTESRRIKSIFSTVVSEKIINELLKTRNLSLGGIRREITVLFADVRGFTELTDRNQEDATNFIRKHNLTGQAAEARVDSQARETLDTVNLYLGLVADTILQHDATLDKFIGDCVMAFWGAPTSNPRHAVACVHAAIAAQRAIYELNRKQTVENHKRELENLARISAGLEPKPMLPCLLLGTGINTGMATAGLMGSGSKLRNYTVFGREINLASRLEGLSGRGRIFINETTFTHLQRDDPALAATCVQQPPAKLKGISNLVTVYEVPWRQPGSPSLEEEFGVTLQAESTAVTGFVKQPA